MHFNFESRIPNFISKTDGPLISKLISINTYDMNDVIMERILLIRNTYFLPSEIAILVDWYEITNSTHIKLLPANDIIVLYRWFLRGKINANKFLRIYIIILWEKTLAFIKKKNLNTIYLRVINAIFFFKLAWFSDENVKNV